MSRSDGSVSGWGVYNGNDIRVITRPGAVTQLSHTLQGRQGFLTWNPASGSTSYEVSDGSGLS
jgi:hypothetical protein